MWKIENQQFQFSMTQSIEAPPETVYDVLANFEAYPDFISDIVSVKRTQQVYEITVKVAILTIPASVRVSADSQDEIAFEMIDGPVQALRGTWQIHTGSSPNETEVTLIINAQADRGSEWLLNMTGKFMQSKSSKLVDAFTKRVEAVHRGEISADDIRHQPSGEKTLPILVRFWRYLTRPLRSVKMDEATATTTTEKVFTQDHQVTTLDALAATIIPPDDFDDGARGLGFPEVAEMRARYEAGRADIYLDGLRGVDQVAKTSHGVNSFINLSFEKQSQLMDSIRQGTVDKSVWGESSPGDFFGALWEDVVFLYCTHPDTWQRLGWPGPSFDTGGYADFDQQQELLGT